MSGSIQTWNDLFAADDDEKCNQIQMRMVSRHGKPLLLLPLEKRPSLTALSLYPAQTLKARLAKSLLRCLLRFSMPLGVQAAQVQVCSGPFMQFVRKVGGNSGPDLPSFAVLAGNPASPGQRFLVMVFNKADVPVAVIKIGLTQQARELVAREATFLKSVPRPAPAIPQLRHEFENDHISALALDYFEGDPPKKASATRLSSLLTQWLDTTRTIRLSQTAVWAQLEGAGLIRNTPLERLHDHVVHPCLQHGDLAPWNVKAAHGGAWTVLDWERGELVGIPGWDWFHWVTQTAILVERLGTRGVACRIARLLGSQEFQEFSRLAKIETCQRELFRVYLLHLIEIVRPSEGRREAHHLFEALSTT